MIHRNAFGEMWVSHSGTCTMAAKAANALASTAENTSQRHGGPRPAVAGQAIARGRYAWKDQPP